MSFEADDRNAMAGLLVTGGREDAGEVVEDLRIMPPMTRLIFGNTAPPGEAEELQIDQGDTGKFDHPTFSGGAIRRRRPRCRAVGIRSRQDFVELSECIGSGIFFVDENLPHGTSVEYECTLHGTSYRQQH